MTQELEAEYKSGLQQAMDTGYAILENGGSAVDAVKAAVISLEDHQLFNAGKGSVFTNTGIHEMDASIMDGSNLAAGAVAAVRNVRNPVELATEVMLHSDHVFLSGEGAKEFAESRGIAIEPDEYFYTQQRFDQLQSIRDTDKFQLDHSDQAVHEKKFGTVGAVACDRNGNIAAATSTGGMTNKRFGRIGDTPIIGSGTYANNKTCAVSCTGHGEVFIRAVAAYDVSCLMEYYGMTLQQACDEVVMKKLMAMEGDGGLIAVDASGNTAMVFNSEGMYRGLKTSEGVNRIAIYAEDV